MIDVKFTFVPDDGSLDTALCRQLVEKMFEGQAGGVQTVLLDRLPEGHAGYSKLTLLVARPFGGGSEENPLLIRVGPRAAIEAEKRRYDAYVEPLVGDGKVAQRGRLAVIDSFAAIAYKYVRGRNNEPPLSLRNFLAAEDDQMTTLDSACHAVTTLFRDTLAQATQQNGWFDNGEMFADQRLLWFYNTVLPPTIVLHDVCLVDEPDSEIALTDLLSLADLPACTLITGKLVYLSTSDAFPQLRIVERPPKGAQDNLRLYLYERRNRPEDEEYALEEVPVNAADERRRPLRPVAARIDIDGQASTLESLPDNLDGKILQGRIVSTRYATLDHIRQEFFGHQLTETPAGKIICGSRVYVNPLQCYHRLLHQPRPLVTSIVHGDMNLGNILLSRLATGDALAWLIDFDKTTSGGHAVFDAVKLETEYKAHILSHRLGSAEEFMRLENVLHEALINPDAVTEHLDEIGHVRDAYQFIANIRRAALLDLQRPIPPKEYYLGLLAYGLAMLKYGNLYPSPENRKRWVQSFAKVEPLAVAAYLSASFAATALPDLDGLVIPSNAYPPPPRPSVPPIMLPRLIGRDDVLEKALRMLGSSQPVVLLHGPVGSGRDTIAQYLAADLERQGYLVWRYPPVEEQTVDGFVKACATFLAKCRQRWAPTEGAIGTAVPGWAREEDLHVAHSRLHDALESMPRRIALLVRLSTANAELRSFLVKLATGVQRTAVILIADTPIESLRRGITLAVSPLKVDQVRAYIRLKHLPLSEEAIQRLYTASHGLPAMLTLLINAAKKQQNLSRSLEQVVLEIEPDHDLTSFLRGGIQNLHESLRCLLELDGLLQCHTPEALAGKARADRLREWVIGVAGWSTNAKVLLKEYHRLCDDHYRGLQTSLQAIAYEQILPADERQLCEWLATFYARPDSPEEIYRAAYYQRECEDWEQLARSLLLLATAPEYVFTGRCHHIYAWTQQVLAQPNRADRRGLLELAGDCAAYLGQYDNAIEHYTDIKDVLQQADAAYPHLLVRMLRACEAGGDAPRAKSICAELLGCEDIPMPPRAFGNSYKSVAQMFEETEEAVAVLEEAIGLMGAPNPEWGREEKEIWVRLHDALAIAEAESDHTERAIKLLKQVYHIASYMPSLQARLDNDLACVHYYYCGQPDDIVTARRRFRQALGSREAIQDHVGIMRTAQNLANLQAALATGADDWQEAEADFTKAENAAGKVRSSDRALIIANHMDALIHRGDFESARTAFARAMGIDVKHNRTLVLLLLNRAKLGLWMDDRNDCKRYLEEALSPIVDTHPPINKIEWAQIALECHICLGGEPSATAAELLSTTDQPTGDQPDTAEWHLAQGLLAYAKGAHQGASEHFDESYRIWTTLGYIYRAGATQLWQAMCAARAGKRGDAHAILVQAEKALLPFGKTPVHRRLQRLRQQIDSGGLT